MAKVKQIVPEHWSRNSGPEKLDPTPMEMPLGTMQPKTLAEMVRDMVRFERNLEDDELETWEEANDFDLPESEHDLIDMSAYQFTDLDEEWPTGPPDEPTETVEAPQTAPAAETPTKEEQRDPAPNNEQAAAQDAG